jgi:hypothetical protein
MSDSTIDITTPEGRRLRAQIAANERWGQVEDRTAATAPGRAAFEQAFLTQANGDPVRAASLRRAHFLRMAAKSAATRRRNRAELQAFREAAAKTAAS